MLPLKKELRVRFKGAKRAAILGIGSPLRGDDALGLVLIEELRKSLKGAKRRIRVKLFSCQTAPENFTGEIKKFKPDIILIIDALDMGKKAGRMSALDAKAKSVNVSFSTHGLPIKMFIDYLHHALSCRVITIGIQPKSLEFGAVLSKDVKKSIGKLSTLLKEILSWR